MTFELGRALLLSRTVTPEGLARALGVTLDPGMPLARAVVGLELVSEEDLHEELARSDEGTALAEVHPRPDVLQMLPTGLCNRLAAMPVDIDEDGAVIVAVLDRRDIYLAEEMSYHLKRPARLVRAPYAILREALVSYASTLHSIVPPPGGRRERRRPVLYTPAWGTPTEESPPSDPEPEHSFSGLPPPPPPVVASVTTSTRRFFAGMHSAPSTPPPADPGLGNDSEGAAFGASGEPVFELRRGPNMTLTDIEPPTQRVRDAPAFPLVASLPNVLPSLALDAISEYLPDPASTLGSLRAASDRDEVLALIERSARAVARRVALLVVKKDTLVGWSCSPEFGSTPTLRALSISTKSPSLLTTVLDGEVYLGPLLGSVRTSLLHVMEVASRDVAMVAVRIAGKPAVLVVCDDLTDTLLATRHLEIMGKVAGEALERVVRAKRG